MIKLNIINKRILSYVFLFIIIVLLILNYYSYPRFVPMTDNFYITNNWKVRINDIENNNSRRKVILENVKNQNEEIVTDNLMYFEEKDFKGVVYNIEDINYLVTSVNNEGSDDGSYYNVYKLDDDNLQKVNINPIWACSVPRYWNKKLYFYRDIDKPSCSLFNIPLLTNTVDLIEFK